MGLPNYIIFGGHKVISHYQLVSDTFGVLYDDTDELEVLFVKMAVENNPFLELSSFHILETLSTKLDRIKSINNLPEDFKDNVGKLEVKPIKSNRKVYVKEKFTFGYWGGSKKSKHLHSREDHRSREENIE